MHVVSRRHSVAKCSGLGPARIGCGERRSRRSVLVCDEDSHLFSSLASRYPTSLHVTRGSNSFRYAADYRRSPLRSRKGKLWRAILEAGAALEGRGADLICNPVPDPEPHKSTKVGSLAPFGASSARPCGPLNSGDTPSLWPFRLPAWLFERLR